MAMQNPEVTHSSEMSFHTWTTQCYTPKDHNIHNYLCGNLKSYLQNGLNRTEQTHKTARYNTFIVMYIQCISVCNNISEEPLTSNSQLQAGGVAQCLNYA
jgi:hypothetical protein